MEELIPIFLFATIAAVMILRPVTKKLGLLIEALAKERMANHVAPRRAGLTDDQLARISATLDRLDSRLDRVDERMSFVERLIENRPVERHLTGS